MSRSAGTGQPLRFQCSACRRAASRARPRRLRDWEGSRYARLRQKGTARRVDLTGHERAAPRGDAYGRSSTKRREYVCLDCGHAGWSRHLDLERKARRYG